MEKPLVIPESLALPASLVLALVQYLDTRPHGEVRQLWDGIQQQVAKQQVPDKKLEIVPPEKPK